jgi:CheY-like chemotaxis protein
VAAVNLDQQLKRDAQLGIASDQRVVQARSGLDEAIAAARSLSIELYPPVLQSSGLPAAVTWLAEQTRKKYGLDVQISADPAANSVRKDIRTLLFESVRELLINAVKHAEADRVAIELALDPDDALCITVTDEGVGFDPAVLFDRGKTGPVGWGLFSIRERLALLGGRLDIESAPGKGTRFRLVAPRGAAQDGAAAPDPLHRAGDERTMRSGKRPASAPPLRILIVDDHASVRRVFRDLLQERREFVVVGDASNGLEGIAQARALRPDVILMDISMPHMDGIEATRRIRAELPFIQILGLSSQLWMEPVHPIEEAGASGYFVKGVDMRRLIEHMLSIRASLALGLQGRTA